MELTFRRKKLNEIDQIILEIFSLKNSIENFLKINSCHFTYIAFDHKGANAKS
jgi:hypothetical protein